MSLAIVWPRLAGGHSSSHQARKLSENGNMTTKGDFRAWKSGMFGRSVRPVGMRASYRAGGGLSSVDVGNSTPKIVR